MVITLCYFFPLCSLSVFLGKMLLLQRCGKSSKIRQSRQKVVSDEAGKKVNCKNGGHANYAMILAYNKSFCLLMVPFVCQSHRRFLTHVMPDLMKLRKILLHSEPVRFGSELRG